jgi:ferredoxin
MTIFITDDCINCRACSVECPTEAIFEPGKNWKENGMNLAPFSDEHFFIVTSFCDECSGFNKIKCITICPMDAIKEIRKEVINAR